MSVEESLNSGESFVLIEAPAGCGKTHTACDYARDEALELSEGQRVLVLAHTNAAVGEFRSRTRDIRAFVKITTFDSLSLSIIAPYAPALGVPHPLRIGMGFGQVRPDDLALYAADLLSRCPVIAEMIARLHPVVILDEHQDARRSQHAIAMALRDAGAMVRAFADPMQRIFVSEEEFPWREVVGDADLTDELTYPYRWVNDLQLGNWILDARARLAAGDFVDLSTAPGSVRVVVVPGPDIGERIGAPNAYFAPVRALAAAGTAGLLTARVRHMATLRIASIGRAAFYEGSDLNHLYTAFETCEHHAGRPRGIAIALLDLLQHVCSGLTTAYRAQVESSLKDDCVVYGRGRRVKPLLDALSILYEVPNVFGAARVCRVLLEQLPDFMQLTLPAALTIFSTILAGSDAYNQLQDAVANYKSSTRVADRVVATVHRSKGHQFEHVLVSNISTTHFPDDARGRRLLYVALSRCQRSLVLLVPEYGRSTLLT